MKVIIQKKDSAIVAFENLPIGAAFYPLKDTSGMVYNPNFGECRWIKISPNCDFTNAVCVSHNNVGAEKFNWDRLVVLCQNVEITFKD